MEKITSIRELQRRIADEVGGCLIIPGISNRTREDRTCQMDDIKSAIQTEGVANLIFDYLNYEDSLKNPK